MAAEIEGRDMTCQLLHGGMSAEDRQQALELFLTGEGILVATSAVMSEGLNLSKVTELVLYDVPGSKLALRQVLGRFNRFGRLSQLNVHALTPSNVEGPMSEALKLLRQILSSPNGAHASH